MTFQTISIGVNRVALPRLFSRAFKVIYAATSVVVLIGGGSELLFPLAALATLASYALIIASYVLSLVEPIEQGEVSVSETELVLQRAGRARTHIRRGHIVGVLLVRRIFQNGLVPTVEVSLRNGDRINVKLAHDEAGTALVRALGFAADGARVRISLELPSRRLLHLPIAFAIYLGSVFVTIMLETLRGSDMLAGFVVVMPLLQLGLYAIAVRVFAAPSVVVGRDGVVVLRPGRKDRLYRADDPALDQELRGVGLDVTRAEKAVYAARERAAGAAPVATLFARGGLSLDEWRSRLVAAMGGGYRTSGNVPDLARSVLASAEVAPDERIGAALALRVAGDLDAVRVASEATADEKVRVVLEAVAAEAEDRVVEKHLGRIR